jgi:hypothetical protein
LLHVVPAHSASPLTRIMDMLPQVPSHVYANCTCLHTQCTWKFLKLLSGPSSLSAAATNASHALLQILYATQYYRMFCPSQYPVPLDRVTWLWQDDNLDLEAYAIECGGLVRILKVLDQLHSNPHSATSMGVQELLTVLYQLKCLVLISVCSPQTVLHSIKEHGLNAMQLCASLCSTLRARAGSKEELMVCEARQAAALKVLLHLVVTADQKQGVQQDVRDELKTRCVVDPVPGVLKEMADGADFDLVLNAERILEGLGMHYMVRR